MADVLVVAATVVVVMVAAMATGAALVLRALVHANRVSPGRRSGAPLGWLWSWRLAARLHRRLRRAAEVAEMAVVSLSRRSTGSRFRRFPTDTVLHEVGAELVAKAVAIDDCVVSASRLCPNLARPTLAQLTTEVQEVEAAACRLQRVCADWRSSMDRAAGLPLPDVHDRLEAVEAALGELPFRL